MAADNDFMSVFSNVGTKISDFAQARSQNEMNKLLDQWDQENRQAQQSANESLFEDRQNYVNNYWGADNNFATDYANSALTSPTYSFYNPEADERNRNKLRSNNQFKVQPHWMEGRKDNENAQMAYEDTFDKNGWLTPDYGSAYMYSGLDDFANRLDQFLGPNRMSLDGKDFNLIQNDDGSYSIPGYILDQNAYGSRANASGEMSDSFFLDRIQDGDDRYDVVRRRDPNFEASDAPIQWVGGSPIYNPSDYERDLDFFLGTDTFKNYMRDNYGIEDVGKDVQQLLYNPEWRPAYDFVRDYMHGLGYYQDVYEDPRFQTDGAFDNDKYWDWIDAQGDISDIANMTDEGRSWLANGGVGVNELTANVLQYTPQRLSSEISEDDLNRYREMANNGELSYDEATGMISPTDSSYGLWLADFENPRFMFTDPELQQQYVMRNLIKEQYSNPYQRGDWRTDASQVNNASAVLGQNDRYYNHQEGDPEDVQQILLPPEEYSNYWLQLALNNLAEYGASPSTYNLDSTARTLDSDLRLIG